MRKKKRREDTTTTTTTLLIKSSSQRKTISENHQTNNIGCMSGIFHLLSKYHRRRKLLTSGEKKDKNVNSTLAKPTTLHSDSELRNFSFEVKRSPTITSEIRRSESRNSSDDVVAKLIGSSNPDSITEKRRKLMESLQKCEEDLNSLKTIIEAVRSTDHCLPSSTPPALMVEVDGGYHASGDNKCSDVDVNGEQAQHQQQPSPVSVLEDISPSSSSPSPIYNRFIVPTNGCDLSFFHKINLEALPRVSHQKEDNNECCYLSLTRMTTKISLTSPFWSSKVKAESINEVYQEAVWEERWELERIGVMLEDYIFGDLIEETVKELGCWYVYSLPFESCRRILHF